MPTYDLRCSDCGNEYAHHCPISDAGEWPQCPTCDSANIRRIYQPTAISFKGDGWAGKTK